MIILPRQEHGYEELLSGFNSGINHLGNGLQELAKEKVQGFKQKQQADNYRKFGLPQELAYMPENIQRDIIEQLSIGGIGGGGTSQQSSGIQALNGAQGGIDQQPNLTQQGSQPQPQLNPFQKIQESRAKQAEILTRREAFKAAREQEKVDIQHQRLEKIEQFKNDKETLPFFKEVTDKGAAAKGTLKRLDRMQELLDTGKLTLPAWHNTFKTLSKGLWGVGIDLHSLENADSQEFNKLSQEFLKDAKSIFGSRITDTDIKEFMKTVPSLSQTDEGKQRIINNLRNTAQADLVKKAAEEVIKLNNGKRPANFQQLVDKISAPELDKLAEDFKTGKGGKEPQQRSTSDAITNFAERAIEPVPGIGYLADLSRYGNR